MADEIKQTFTIDASQALDALRQLDQGYTSLSGKLDATAKAISSFNRRAGNSGKAFDKAIKSADAYNQTLQTLATGGLTNVANQSQQLSGALKQFGRSSQQSMNAAAKSTQNFVISWETLSRVVMTQFIVRAMSQFRDAVSAATEEAIDFQRQVALITTIASDTGFDQIATSVRNISDSFNLPLLDTAKGVYQALSNQVGNFADSLRFTEEAAKFARSTNSSLADSVDLLSGALRSYGLNVEDTGRVAGIFFTAIDKGRVTADQLANAFGRVGPGAEAIGISLEELAAAAATISDKGIATAETLTQFRGIITALTKPTDAMKERLRELGFSSTEAAIATLRLDGVLDALAGTTDGSQAAFAKLFPNIRGIGGATALTGDNLKTFADNIREAQANGEEFANSKFLLATATDGEVLTKAINQIKNAFTIELGQALVKTGADLLGTKGSVEAITQVIKIMAQTIPALTGAAIALAGALGTVKIATLALASPVNLVVTALAALAVAIPASLNAIKDARTKNALKGITGLEEANAAEFESFTSTQNNILNLQKKIDQELVAGAFTKITEINKAYLKDVDNAKNANDAVVANTEASLDKILSARTKFVSAIESAITESQQQVKDSVARIADLRIKQDDRQFDTKTKDFDDAQKVFALNQRAAQIASKATADLKAAFASGDDDARNRALGQFQRADAAAAEAQSIGERAGNRVLEAQSAKQLESITNQQIRAEEEINRLQAQRQKALASERDRQEGIVKQLREQTKLVLDNTGQFDKNGQLLDPDELAKRSQARAEGLKKIAELAFSGKDFKAADALGLADFVSTIENDLSQRPIKLVFDVESSIQKVQAEIQKSLGNLDVQLPFLKDAEKLSGRSLRDSPDDIRKGIQDLQTEGSNLRQQRFQRASAELKIEQKRAEVLKGIADLEARLPQREALGPESQPARDATQSAIEQLKSDAAAGDISVANLNLTLNKLKEIDFGSQFGVLKTDADLIQKSFQSTAELAQNLNQLSATPQIDEARLAAIENVLNKVGETDFTAVSNLGTGLSNAVEPSSFVATNATTTATAYERAAAAIQSVQGATLPVIPSSTLPEGNQFGRVRYFADGGMARGVDTIPAMLRAGETVINPKSSSRFFSQLQAINAGQNPVFRQDGGTVNNTNVGDIHIHGATNPKASGKAVVDQINRLKRRGAAQIR